MGLRLITYFILLFLLVVGLLIIYTRPSGAFVTSDSITPDITVPPTLQVTVTVAEDQEASNEQYGVGLITLAFKTNEVIPPATANFINGESVSCNGSSKLPLGNATSYWFRVGTPYNASYTCTYYYPNLKGQLEPAPIFTQPVLSQLLPELQRPVPSNSDISVNYHPDINPPHYCQVQVTANAPNGNATGSSVTEDGSIYPGPKGGTLNVGSLNGLGDIVMTRTCTPPNIVHNNSNNGAECGCPPATTFSLVNVTYTSTATYEVSWYPPGSLTQGTNP